MPANKNTSSSYFARKLTSNFILIVAAVLAAILPFNKVSASDRIILECSAGAVDEISLAECVALKLEQAEVTLEQAEDAWQNLLQSTPPSLEGDSQTNSNEVQSDSFENDDSQIESSDVIAIVNDSALKSGVSTAGTTVINIDEGDRPIDGPIDESAADQVFDTSVDSQERFGFLPALFRLSLIHI